MPEIAEVWSQALPRVKHGVTGVGVWAALNACRPVALEDGLLAIGMPYEEGELAGHLRMAATSRLIEEVVSEIVGSTVKVRIIDGTALEDWERVKRRDQEARRLQEQAVQKEKAAMAGRSSWEGIYEQLGRAFSMVGNKSLPQNRARFLKEAVAMLAEARKAITTSDDYTERNFARCIERIAQYSETPSAVVAHEVLKAAGEL